MTTMFGLPLALSLLLFSSTTSADPLHLPISRRSYDGQIDYACAADRIRLKYGYGVSNYSCSSSLSSMRMKRASTDFQITDQSQDALYFTSIDMGTPPQTLNVILDTGSSDLWVADSSCSTCSSATPVYNSAGSSSSRTATGFGSQTTISYGSGAVSGTLSSETVTMGGFTVDDQIFLAVDQTTQGLLSGSVSGIMGLAFEAIASTQSTPFWQTLASNGDLSDPEMGFWLARFRGDTNVATEETNGGSFTLGGTNSSLFTGDIEFLDTSSSPSFWLLSMTDLTANGNSISLTSSSALSAIDTGTTLIGGPADDVAAFWDQIPNSRKANGQPGLYSFPCSDDVEVTVSFGGKSWPINTRDMSLGPERTGSDMCLGGIFDLSAGSNIPANSGAPGWVVGSTFLKNVYSVFRASNPPAIGFAQLSDAAGGSGTPGASSSGGSSSSSGSGSGSGSGSSESDGGVGMSGSVWGVLISGLFVIISGIVM